MKSLQLLIHDNLKKKIYGSSWINGIFANGINGTNEVNETVQLFYWKKMPYKETAIIEPYSRFDPQLLFYLKNLFSL